ncbi:MAG: SRPBCC family protein [Gemmatimonadaceae bacterium]
MLWILTVMALIVSVVLAVLVGGFATPRKHTAARMITLRATPDAVWALVRDVKEYSNWRDDIQSVELSAGNDPRPVWTEIGRTKSISYRAEIDEPPTRFSARIMDDDLGYSGEWQYVLSPLDGGTRVTITEVGEVSNPVFRFFGNFLGHTSAIDAFLSDLAAELREHVKPQPVTA